MFPNLLIKMFMGGNGIYFTAIDNGLVSPMTTDFVKANYYLLTYLGCMEALLIVLTPCLGIILLLCIGSDLYGWGAQRVQPLSINRSTLENSAISTYEVLAPTSVFIGILCLNAVSATTADDIVDSFMLGVAGLVGVLIGLLLTSLNSFLLYALSPASRGEGFRGVWVADAQNIILSFGRVVLC